ncbi:restriction endonuclease PLD domain-containing protein [Duncaniella dubosii]|jgi:HKD family nuclease|uniref:restriction endonuclease PLD domain-containing protein n=2 Tax=Duncaniella TaxID=2518495 RepID=UPI0025B63653|nr:restriction endonuclease PLD domain-containing protein [uncultured Duncaniella sp.]
MEVLLSSNPIISNIGCKSVRDYYRPMIETADQLNIATGFITNDSIVELQNLIEYRNHRLTLNLFIGMNLLEGFTKLQYNAVRDLNSFLTDSNTGRVLLSPKALYHGKMYSFLHKDTCLGAFIGSSNLGSFVGTSNNYIEAEAYFNGQEASYVNSTIVNVIERLGSNFSDLPPVTEFIPNPVQLLKDYNYVEQLSQEQTAIAKASVMGPVVRIPLKDEPKSNLNTYFGAGKIKDKFSPRGWYEVELIIPKNLENRDILPWSQDKEENKNCHIFVISNDGYKFECYRQGDYGKNFRSANDLKILGRWIKGQMENDGALELGKPVTKAVLDRFGKHFLVLQKTVNNCWYMTLE